MSQNVELVRRFYALVPSLGEADPNDDPALFDWMVGDYLDEEFELRYPGDYPEGEPSSGEERDSRNCSRCCGTLGPSSV